MGLKFQRKTQNTDDNNKMKQNSEIKFKCTTEQKDKIKKKAEEVGFTIKQYLLHLGLRSTIIIKGG